MDVYVETTRLFLNTPDQQRLIIDKHFSFLIVTSIVFGPLAGFAFFTFEGGFPLGLYLIFPIFFIAEIFANDTARLLPPLRHPFLATMFLFLRQFSPLVIILFLNEVLRIEVTLLDTILVIFGSTLVLTAIVLIVFRAKGYSDSILRFDPRWIILTVRSSALFFAGTVVFRVLFGFDRFIVSSATDLATAGVYALYVSFGLGIVSVLEAGVSAWKYPPIVKSILQRDPSGVLSPLRSFVVTNLISATLMCLAAYVTIHYIVLVYLEPEYHAGLEYLHWILFGSLTISGSLPLHYLLYGLRKDYSFLIIYLVALASVAVYGVLVLDGGGIGEAFGLFFVAAFVTAVGRLLFAIGPILSIRKGLWQ